MAIQTSGGVNYIGIGIYAADPQIVPWVWQKFDEVYEFTDFDRTVDMTDMTSHRSYEYEFTRTAKPGLFAQAQITFKGIWRRKTDSQSPADIHNMVESFFIGRTALMWKIEYPFIPVADQIAYQGLGYISNYTLSGDLGDKFVYSLTVYFEGMLQPTTSLSMESKVNCA